MRLQENYAKENYAKEEIETLMNFIEAKLDKNKGLNQAKLQLINCQLSSVA